MAIPGLARACSKCDEAARLGIAHVCDWVFDARRVAKIRRFVLRRIEDVSGVSGVGIVAEGVVFSDGKVSLHWTVTLKSTAVYDSIEDLEAIHGHNGATRVEWIDTKDGE